MSLFQKIKIIIAYIPLKIRYWYLAKKWYLQQNQSKLERWLKILVGGIPRLPQINVSYGHEYIPRLGEVASGGIVKFQRMQEDFPNAPRCFNILYMVSSARPQDSEQLLWLARRKGAKFLWNQNGVAYPAWHGEDWEKTNEPLAKMLHEADHVFYQSQFCKLSSDRFLGERKNNWEILYNCVDTTQFTPATSNLDRNHLILLLGGSQYQYYRLETALKTLAILACDRDDVDLWITGRLSWLPDETETHQIAKNLVEKLGISDRVNFLGKYSQNEAPKLFQNAHILLHTKYNDPCPGLVVEAMACGLPIVYSQSGGVPELVGEEAGIGIPTELSWEKDLPPDPKALADAILQVSDGYKQYSEAARNRAVEKFDLRPWLQRHREIFEELLS
ncbi:MULTISPECIES: glycosyltransferase family 4 protein [Spirulina sp. CCY15215]|uniref:glycosyltransferase family 4 protein n=1 Tax=Spirulina sp. CCY15215 TaxID=2767591 RepID=UPI00194DC661